MAAAKIETRLLCPGDHCLQAEAPHTHTHTRTRNRVYQFQTSTVGIKTSLYDFVHTLQREREMIQGGKNPSQPTSSSEQWLISTGSGEFLHLLKRNLSPRVELLVLGVESCQPRRLRQPIEMLAAQIPTRPLQACLTERGRSGRARTCGRDYVSHPPLGGPWDSPGAEPAKCWSQYKMSAKGWQA